MYKRIKLFISETFKALKKRPDLFFFVLPFICILVVICLFLTLSLIHQVGGYKHKITYDNKSNGALPQKVSILVDAGHGGDDWGAYYGNVKEKTVNLDISLRLGKLLNAEGIKVIYTRETDVFVDLHERPKMANAANATLYISIHNNSMPGDSGYKGTETLYAASTSSEYSKMNDKKLADIVENELVKELGTINGGIIYRPNLAVLHLTKMPAIIAEIGYLTNKSERNKLTEPDFRQKAANALCVSVMGALNQMGAYKDKSGEWMVIKD